MQRKSEGEQAGRTTNGRNRLLWILRRRLREGWRQLLLSRAQPVLAPAAAGPGTLPGKVPGVPAERAGCGQGAEGLDFRGRWQSFLTRMRGGGYGFKRSRRF